MLLSCLGNTSPFPRENWRRCLARGRFIGGFFFIRLPMWRGQHGTTELLELVNFFDNLPDGQDSSEVQKWPNKTKAVCQLSEKRDGKKAHLVLMCQKSQTESRNPVGVVLVSADFSFKHLKRSVVWLRLTSDHSVTVIHRCHMICLFQILSPSNRFQMKHDLHNVQF